MIGSLKHLKSTRLLFFAGMIALGMSFLFKGFELLAFAALLPIIEYVYRINFKKRRQAYKDFYLGGAIVCGLVYIFILDIQPINWPIVVPIWLVIVASIAAWLFVTLFCALSFLGLAWILVRIKSDTQRIFALPVLWVMAEVVKSYLFAIISFGNGSKIAPVFNWGSLAVAASGTNLVFASRLVGFFGLSLVAFILVLAVYMLLVRQNMVVFIVLAMGVLTFSVVGYNFGNYDSSRIAGKKIVIVHLDEADVIEDWSDFDSIPGETDLLVLPEYSEITEPGVFKKIATKLSNSGVGITSIATGKSPNSNNSLILFNNKAEIVSKQQKDFLIPTGEYLPYSIMAVLKLFGQQQVITNFNYIQKVTPGGTAIRPVSYNNLTVGTLICSGVLQTGEYSNMVNQGSQLLVNVSSLAFIRPNSRYHVFGHNMARFHAVSNSRPFFQAMRSGESLGFSAQGEELFYSNDQNSRVLVYQF